MLAFARSLILASASLLGARSDTRTSAAQDAIRWEPYSTVGADGAPLDGELGRLRVPENRAKKNGKTIELAFVRFRTSNPKPGPTIVYLVGGPGPSGIENCLGPVTGRRVRLLDFADVIALDQRGTGLSRPNLEDGPRFEYALPTDRAITREDFVRAYSSAVERCVAHWTSAGVDLAAYDTNASADDVEDLRKALGLATITTWGESYGTHLTLALLRRHPEHVARSVLIRVEGPDHTLKLPSTTQRHLERLHELVAADPGVASALPDFLGSVRALLAQLREAPVKVDLGGGRGVVIGAFDLQSSLANALGLVMELRDVPARVHALTRGDWSRFAESVHAERRGEVGSAMALMMDCASGASKARLARIAKEALDPRNLLGDAVNVPYPAVCAACGSPDVGDVFRGPLKCDVPVLFVSGDLDARTPKENVLEIAGGFSKATHVLVENAGHESLEVLSPEYVELLKAFLRGEAVESKTITLPQPRFTPIEAR